MAKKRTLVKVANRSFEWKTQSAFFSDAFSRRARNLSCFPRPVVNTVKSHNGKTVKVWRISVKVEAVLPRELSDPWPQPPFFPIYRRGSTQKPPPRSPQSSSIKDDLFREERDKRELYLSVSSDKDASSHSLGHQSLLSDLSRQPDAGSKQLYFHLPVMEPVLPVLRTVKRDTTLYLSSTELFH